MHRTVLVIAALLVLTPIAGVAGASTPAPDTTATADAQDASYGDVIDTPNESIGVWERAAFPFRADTSNANTTIQNQQMRVGHWDPTKASPGANYPYIGVYNDDQSIPINFDDLDLHPIHQFASENANATIVAGKLDATKDDIPENTPSSIGAFTDLFKEQDLSNLNDNATFKRLGDETIESDGFSTTFDPSETFGEGAGQYVVMAAVPADTTADAPDLLKDGALAPAEDVVVVGMESVVTQDTNADTAPLTNNPEPGDSITFDANADIGADGDVHHAIALYDKETFTDAQTTFNLTEKPSADFSADDVIIESEIAAVNGVSDLDEGIPRFGDIAGDASQSGTVKIDDIVTLLEGEFNEDAPEFDPEEDAVTLDGSVVSVADGNQTEELAVETFGNWSETEYQWVHVAGTEDGELATDAGTLTIESDGGGGGPIMPPPAPRPDPGDDITLVDTSLSSAKVAAGESFEVSATFENAASGSATKTVDLTRDGQTVDTKTITLAAGAEETVTFTQTVDEPGSYAYAIDGTNVGTVDVSSKGAVFETSNADVSDTDVSVGDSVDVTATVENTGDATGTHTAELVVDGETVDTTEVTLEPGASGTAEFTHTFDETGDYEVSVDDAAAGTVSVEGGGGDLIPGFGPVAALLALTATLLIARTRSA